MIIAIIQARMSSTRLPGKVLKKISGKTLLEILIERLRYSKKLDKIIIATSFNKKDRAIVKLAKKIKCSYFVGDENDVLDRFYKTAKKFKADTVVRITADCPLHDPELIDDIINYYLMNRKKYDYVSNVNPPTFPDGFDLWVFSFKTLEKVWENAKLKSEREHVCPYIWKNKKMFKIGHYKSKINYSNLRLTVDDRDDFNVVRKIYQKLYKKGKIFKFDDIINLIKKNPDLLKIQKGKFRDEGYSRSIKEDKELFKIKKYKSQKFIIKGKQIYLKKLNKYNATNKYCSWLNDKEVNKYLVNKYREGRKATINEIKKYIHEKNNNSGCFLFGIFFKNNNKHIGNIKLEPIDFNKKNAITGILIGDKKYWGKGIASEAIKLVINFSFKNLKLSELNLGVLPENKSAIRVYEKNGFILDKIKRKSIKLENKLYDNYLMKLINHNK